MSAAARAHVRTCGAVPSAAARLRVRDATRDDVPHVLRMIQELAEFEGVPDGPKLSVEGLIEDAFESSPPWCFILVAELVETEPGALAGAGDGAGAGAGARLAGYALCNRAYSSWTGRALYVEDLFVRPDLRSRGIGTQLLARLCQIAVSSGAHRIDWHVLESNSGARAFYSRLGARCLRESEGRAALRLDDTYIRELARRDHDTS